jgi:hypothetical protein
MINLVSAADQETPVQLESRTHPLMVNTPVGAYLEAAVAHNFSAYPGDDQLGRCSNHHGFSSRPTRPGKRL